jgi:hypothetical protein
MLCPEPDESSPNSQILFLFDLNIGTCQRIARQRLIHSLNYTHATIEQRGYATRF